MAAPWKDPSSGVWHLRQRTPRDLVACLRKTSVVLPIGDGRTVAVAIGEIVKVSLRTKDDRVAKARHAAANAALQAVWQQARSSYVAQPLADHASHQAPSIRSLPGPAGGLSWDTAVKRFGSVTTTLLEDLGVPTTDANCAGVISQTASVMDEAFAIIRRDKLVEGQPVPQKGLAGVIVRPERGEPTVSKPATLRVTVAELWEQFRAYHNDKLAVNTLHRYDASVSRLAAYFSERDVRSLTSDDVHAWATHRRDVESIHPRTINSNDLVAISSLFKWAMKREGGRLLTHNPVVGERLDEPRPTMQRERTFRDAEVEVILRAALSVRPKKARDFNADAQRWCPWLAAYSGARISELTALTVEDIRKEQSVDIMHFSETKTNIARSVPIHEHLIAQGFLDFVGQVGSGPLFFDPVQHDAGARTPPHEIRSRKVAHWVRTTAKLDMQVDPNHGWRHTFKSRALGRMDERIRDAIVGHQPGSVARRYETPSITQMGDAMKMFPRYHVD